MSADPHGARAARDPGRLAVAPVRALTPYVPGKPIEDLLRELGDPRLRAEDVAKLASNENPHGPSPLALAAMRRALDQVWLYPDGACHALKAALAAALGVTTAELTIGNGSNELLMLLAEAFLDHTRSAVYSQYGFAIYPLVIRATGAEAIEVPARPGASPMPLGHDLGAMARAIGPDTRLVFVANPNNPTGTWATGAELEAFIAAVPADVLIVLDEAYVEYGVRRGAPDGLVWRQAYPNLVILRTFSKAYGLAGARVGYMISHPGIADALDRIRPAFNVNSIAQAGAVAALGDRDHLERGIELTLGELERVEAALTTLGWRTIPSAANFLLLEVGDRAAELYDTLLRGGIIVRPVGGYGLAGYLRITIGTREQNDRLLMRLGPARPSRP